MEEQLMAALLKFLYATEDGDVQEVGGQPLIKARKLAKKLVPAYREETGSLHLPTCDPDCATHHKMPNESPYGSDSHLDWW